MNNLYTNSNNMIIIMKYKNNRNGHIDPYAAGGYFPAGTGGTMYVHCTYSSYNVRTMYVHCTSSARWVWPIHNDAKVLKDF